MAQMPSSEDLWGLLLLVCWRRRNTLHWIIAILGLIAFGAAGAFPRWLGSWSPTPQVAEAPQRSSPPGGEVAAGRAWFGRAAHRARVDSGWELWRLRVDRIAMLTEWGAVAATVLVLCWLVKPCNWGRPEGKRYEELSAAQEEERDLKRRKKMAELQKQVEKLEQGDKGPGAG